MKKIVCLLLALALLPLVHSAAAPSAEAKDLSAGCSYTVASKGFAAHRMFDRDWHTYWNGEAGSKTITIKSPEPIFGLYIGWFSAPRQWVLEQKIGETWQQTQFEPTPIQHMYYALDGALEIRLKPVGRGGDWFGMEEIFVLGAGEKPSFVQTWELPDDKCDLLVFFAHPDDEALFFGGTLPTYAGERGLDVVTAVFTPSARYRATELLNSLWEMGVRNYPVFGPFHDAYSVKLDKAYKEFGKTKSQGFAVELFRKYRPDVVISHDVNGEYGHGMHQLCADLALYAFDAAADNARFAESAITFGAWQASKLYLHLYPDNQREMDWDRPLSTFDGRTGFEVAQAAYAHHVSQLHLEQYQVEPRGSANSSYRFGLAKSTVGPDTELKDFFENLGLPEMQVNDL